MFGKLGLMEGESSKINHSSDQTKSSLETISILVVDDDTTCLSIVAAILKRWKYEVVTVKHPIDALHTLRIKGSSFDLVVSDVHMPDMNGFELQKKIDEEFNLPVVLMSADDKEGVILKGIESGAAFFLVKPIAPDDLRDLWQYTTASNKKGKGIVSNESESAQEKSVKGSNEGIESSLSTDEDIHNRKDSKRKSTGNENGDEFEDDEVDFYTPKKTKVVWTNELHSRFLEAIKCLGVRAVPKKIHEVMRVPGLTRENIASHLQKYRIFLNRVQKATQRIQSSSERSLADQTLLRSTFAMNTPSLILNELRRQSIRSTYYRSAENVPLVYSSNLGSTPFSNHRPCRTNSFVPQSGQSSLLFNQGLSSRGGTSSGLLSGTSSMQMYQPLTQATPKSTLTNIGLPNYNATNTTYGILNNSSPMGLGCVVAPNSFAGTSGLMNFGIQNDYISPSTGTSSSGTGRAKDYTFASMNIGNSNKNNNSYAFDTNVLLQQPYEVGDLLTSIFLNEVNNQSPHQQENDDEILDWGSLPSAYNMEENPVTMNQQFSEQAPVQQLLGETTMVSNLCSLGSETDDYFPSFDPSPSQEQIPGGLFGSNVNSNQGIGLSPSERNDDDFLESILCNEPDGEGDN